MIWEPDGGRTLERDGATEPRDGADPRLARLLDGFGAGVPGRSAVAFGFIATAPGFGLAAGLETGFGAGLGAVTEGRAPVEERVTRLGEGLEAGFDAGFVTGRGGGVTLVLRDWLDPRETIEGDGLETGFGAGREAIDEPRGGLDERWGETRLTVGALGRGATRVTEGGLGAWRMATGGREIGALRDTLGRDGGALRDTLGPDGAGLGLDMAARGDEGAWDWARPPEEPPPEFRWFPRPCASRGTGPRGTSSMAAAQAASR